MRRRFANKILTDGGSPTMTPTELSRPQLISAVQELAVASSLDALQDVLDSHPFLVSAEADRQLTRAIQAGLRREAFATISVLIVVRGFLERLRNDGIESALDAVGGVPLYQADPIGQLIHNPQPSPHQVDICRRALEIVRRDTEPSLWAYLNFLLADRLMLTEQGQAVQPNQQLNIYLLPTDHLSPNVQEAMEVYEVAGDAWEACQEPEQAARARYKLARLLIDFVTGEQRAVELERAIKLLESTFSVWRRNTHPQQWSDVQAAMGLALKNMPGGLDAQTLECAISHYEEALQIPVDPSFEVTFEKVRRQYHLGTLYTRRYKDSRVADIERAIELLEAALGVQMCEAYPEEWADAQNALANALQQRLRGDPAQNKERAIRAYRSALRVWERDRDPTRWAAMKRNLAEAYRHRILGQPGKNQNAAITYFGEALTVYTPEEHPTEWASVHNSLANLYCNRLEGDRADNIETGIQYYTQALRVYTRDTYPRQWAQTTNNLANAYCERDRDDHSDNLRTAITLYKQVLEVRTHKDYPREWAATHNNIGTAYAGLGEWKQASEHFREALEVRTVSALPDKTLQSARNLGALHFRLGRWGEAINAYRTAQEASDALYRQAITETSKRAEIGRGGEVTHPLAYALARKGKLREAVLELEHGRARLLAEALARGRVALDQASDKDRAEYEKAVSRIRALQSELRAAELDAQGSINIPSTARAFVEIAKDLSAANEELDRIVKATSRVPGHESLAQPRFTDVTKAVQPDMPLVYLTVTPAGGLALFVHAKGVKRVWFDSLTERALSEHVQEWFGIYFAYLKARRDYKKARKELIFREISGGEKETILKPLRLVVESTRQAWFAILEDTTHWLWDMMMGRLVATLRKRGYCRATLIPTGLLAFLPLHAAWHPGGVKSSRHYALDDVAFAYAPSARALTHAQRIAADAPGETLFAVNNPDGSLHYTNQEVGAVACHFSEPWILGHDRATRNTALAALPQCDVYHLACHGNNNWQNPLESALWMYGKVPLTVHDLLGMEGRSQARLAFLSACETGLIGAELPDEVVGLAAGFMRAGTAGVVSTLWSVDDESTALLAEQLYENWKERRMSLLEALVAAQQWLRDNSGRDRWRHPHYWAALMLTGV